MLTWWATGLPAKIQKPNSLVGLGSEVSAGGSGSRPVLAMQCHVNARRAGGRGVNSGKAGEGLWARPTQQPRVPLHQPERAARIIRKSGERKAGLSACQHAGDLQGAGTGHLPS